MASTDITLRAQLLWKGVRIRRASSESGSTPSAGMCAYVYMLICLYVWKRVGYCEDGGYMLC